MSNSLPPAIILNTEVRNIPSTIEEKSASQQIDAIIQEQSDWRGQKLAELRALIKQADPAVVEEVKWKKPSRPEGVPVWSHGGNICIADILKESVRLTFPKGAQMKDPQKVFNTRLDSKTVRAMDFHENDPVDEEALIELVLEAVRLNTEKSGRDRASGRQNEFENEPVRSADE